MTWCSIWWWKAYSRRPSQRGVRLAVARARAAPAPAGVRALRVERGQRLVPEHRADHAGLLQRALLGGGRPSSRACSTPVRVGGTLVASSLSALSVQRSPPVLDRALVDQHLDQLFHVEGIALGAAGDELAQRCGNLGQLLQQLVGELAACASLPSGPRSMRCDAARAPGQSARRSNSVGRVKASISSGTSRLTSAR